MRKHYIHKSKKLEYCENLINTIKKDVSNSPLAEKQNVYQEIPTSSSTSCAHNKILYLKNNTLYSRKRSKNYSNNTRKDYSRNIKLNIKSFFEQDENSIFAPGCCDFVTKNKLKKRKRYLTDTVENLYRKYCSISNNKISRALFYRFKPFWVVPRSINTRDTCLCKQHPNFKLITDRLCLLKVVKSKGSDEFRKFVCCDGIMKKECMFSEYNLCVDKKVSCDDN